LLMLSNLRQQQLQQQRNKQQVQLLLLAAAAAATVRLLRLQEPRELQQQGHGCCRCRS
jgi:hypothetical protein